MSDIQKLAAVYINAKITEPKSIQVIKLHNNLIFGSGTDFILLYLLLLFFPWGDVLQKSLRVSILKSDRDNIYKDCSSSKYAPIDGDRFLI